MRVVKDGTHGSATPPQWKGLNANQADPNASLAAYAIDHTAISATLSGQATSWGRVSAYVGGVCSAATLFGNPSLGSSVDLVLGGAGLGGTFTVSYGGQTTSGLSPTTTTAAQLQTALRGLSSIGANNVNVSGNTGGPYTITLAGTLANLAGGALGFSVDGSGLTATGPSVVATGGLSNDGSITFYGVTGGTFTLTANGGHTTAPIAWNADGPTVLAAMKAAAIPPTYNSSVMVNVAIPGSFYFIYAHVTIDATNLTGGATAYMKASADSGNGYAWSIPPTYYVAFQSTAPAYAWTGVVGNSEPHAGTTGYHRVAVANNTTTFGASSSGAKTSGATITFPAATSSYTVQAISFFSTQTGTRSFLTLQLATPLVVAQGTAPTINLGALTFTHTPYTGTFAGGMTDYAWGKVYDLLFGGVSFTVPSTWYASLSTAALSRTTTTLSAEPSGNGYARAAITNNATNWLVPYSNDYFAQAGDARNGVSIAFPAPTAAWGSIVAAALTDAASGGNAWFVAQLTAPVAPAAGTHAPTFATGAFTLATA